jgi:DNA modification methylase
MFGIVGNVGISITNKKGISKEHKITDANIWLIKRENKDGLHAALKPQELIQKAIKNSSFDSDLILDLFLGSGSTMVAAHQLNRKCYGMELDPKYCQVIIDRMRKLDPTLTITRNGQPYKTAD